MSKFPVIHSNIANNSIGTNNIITGSITNNLLNLTINALDCKYLLDNSLNFSKFIVSSLNNQITNAMLNLS